MMGSLRARSLLCVQSNVFCFDFNSLICLLVLLNMIQYIGAD